MTDHRSPQRRRGANRLERAAHGAQLVMALATVSAIVWGAFTYYHTSRAQEEAQAVTALQEYWKLAAENPEVSPTERSDRVFLEIERDAIDPDAVLTEEYAWGAKHAMFAADSAYQLAGREPRPWEGWVPGAGAGIEARVKWQATIRSLASFHDTYLLSIEFPCEQHSEQFKDFLRERAPYENLCAPQDREDRLAKKRLMEVAAAQDQFYDRHDSYTQFGWKLESQGFLKSSGTQNDPAVTVDYGDRNTYCMDAPGGARESWEVTPLVTEPIPGDCIGY